MNEVDGYCNEIDAEVCRCPTCGATQSWRDECRRCGTDINLLCRMAEEAMELRAEWTAAMSVYDFRKAEQIMDRLRIISPSLLCDLLHDYTRGLNRFTSEFYFTS